jgi:exodeoxyribonuclease-3
MLKNYRFISWNVNGIRAIDKKGALKWIDDEKVDILSLQEIKATKEQIPSTLFKKSFKHLFVNSGSVKGRHGVAMYCDIEPYFTDNAEHIDTLKEGRINEVHFKTDNHDVAFFNVYFPNGQMSEERLQYKLAFYERFLAYCLELKKIGKSVIVCGDVNTAHKEIDLKRPKANENTSGFLPVERAWIDKFLASGFIDTFRFVNGDIEHQYTWWSYKFNARKTNAGWRIDYFFVSDDLKENITDAKILSHITGSDHCPISLEIKL